MADWTDPSAVYLCDTQAKVLSIKSAMDTSSPDDPGTVLPPPKYRPLTSAKNFKCTFGRVSVRASTEVQGPHPTGTCAGFTHTYIHSFQVNGKLLFSGMQSFNSACFSDPELYEIEVRQIGTKVHIKTCYATWDWGVGYKQDRCDAQDL
jgi:hypothetical protein